MDWEQQQTGPYTQDFRNGNSITYTEIRTPMSMHSLCQTPMSMPYQLDVLCFCGCLIQNHYIIIHSDSQDYKRDLA